MTAKESVSKDECGAAPAARLAYHRTLLQGVHRDAGVALGLAVDVHKIVAKTGEGLISETLIELVRGIQVDVDQAVDDVERLPGAAATPAPARPGPRAVAKLDAALNYMRRLTCEAVVQHDLFQHAQLDERYRDALERIRLVLVELLDEISEAEDALVADAGVR